MSCIAKLLSFVRGTSNEANVSDVKVDIGGGDNRTAQHFSNPGDDSHPLKTDYVLTSDIPRNGVKAAHGYLDPVNEGVAQEGDKRIYGRDKDTGVTVNEVWIKNDGSILESNDNGFILLEQNGNVNLNGVIIDPNGNITTPTTITADTITAKTSLIAALKELVGHLHLAGVPPGDTGPNK